MERLWGLTPRDRSLYPYVGAEEMFVCPLWAKDATLIGVIERFGGYGGWNSYLDNACARVTFEGNCVYDEAAGDARGATV